MDSVWQHNTSPDTQQSFRALCRAVGLGRRTWKGDTCASPYLHFDMALEYHNSDPFVANNNDDCKLPTDDNIVLFIAMRRYNDSHYSPDFHWRHSIRHLVVGHKVLNGLHVLPSVTSACAHSVRITMSCVVTWECDYNTIKRGPGPCLDMMTDINIDGVNLRMDSLSSDQQEIMCNETDSHRTSMHHLFGEWLSCHNTQIL